MPDRFGETDEPVADFDSRRRAHEAEAARERAAQQRARLAETRAVHAPLSSEQSNAARTYQRQVTTSAEKRRNQFRIANCQLCDDDGYTPGLVICDHVDHRPAAARGMQRIREAMGWNSKSPPDRSRTPAPTQTPAPNPSNPQETYP